MKIKEIIGALTLSGGWASMLFSVALYALFWRVDNEPGAKDFPALWWGALSFCSLGGLAFLAGNMYLLIKKAWVALAVAWVLCIVILFGAISLSPILLLLMV